MQIRRVEAHAVRPMRSEILRPGIPPEKLVYPLDDAPDSAHFAAFEGERIVGIASVYRAPRDGSSDESAWQLRGMATALDVRGKGYGAALVRAAIAHAKAHGGTSMWFNARVVALGFYRKLGFESVGEEFDIPGVGPHYVMVSRLT